MKIFRCAGCGGVNRVGQAPAGQQPVCGRCKQPLDVSGAPQEVDAAGLKAAVSASPIPVLVDFWAPWCPPCRRAAPLLEQLARARAGQVLVLKVNTQDHPEAAAPHRIQSIPSFLLFRGGAERDRQVGLPPPEAFARWVDGHLDRGPGAEAAQPGA
jgi:thioredoxin 2